MKELQRVSCDEFVAIALKKTFVTYVTKSIQTTMSAILDSGAIEAVRRFSDFMGVHQISNKTEKPPAVTNNRMGIPGNREAKFHYDRFRYIVTTTLRRLKN